MDSRNPPWPADAASRKDCNPLPAGRNQGPSASIGGSDGTLLVEGSVEKIFVFISKLLYHPRRLVNFYLVRFWSPRRSGVTLATTHKAGFFDPGGRHTALASQRTRDRPIASFVVGILHMTKMYVGNLPVSMDESSGRALFEKRGSVQSVALIHDRDTGRPRGFGFVEMASAQPALCL